VVNTPFDQATEHEPAGLSLPVQAPPVRRPAIGTAGPTSAANGVEPNGLEALQRLLDIDVDWGPFHGGIHV
jgi:hypothetical protein